MSPVSREHQVSWSPAPSTTDAAPIAAPAPLPRRSFLTGRLLDPELHPPLRHRIARAVRRA
jgi:hypothetical protein